ncbi:MAG: hypothetical protein ACO2Z9_04300, partial [Crocinitomicaceae bacterium]
MNFFSDLSLWWSIPWLAISVALTYWYYHGQKVFKQTEKWKRILLLFLRSAGLFLLGVLLLGILFESREVKTQKPVLINLIDNSSSMLNYKDSSIVKQQLSNYLKEFGSTYADKYEIQNFIVDDGIRSENPDFKGALSNHYKGFDEIFNRYYNQNKGAIIFISDGNYNTGNSPVYSAQKISLTPIYTLGVGDTVSKVDHLIRNVSANEIAFFRNDFPVDVEIEANKIPTGDYTLELWSNDKKLGTQQITYDASKQQFHTAKFVVNASRIGFVPYEVRLQLVDGESSTVNNSRKFYVEVIDSRSKVLMLASGPHPDIKAIRQMLDQDENVEVESKLLSDWEGSLNDVSLLVIRSTGAAGEKAVIDQA